jgi:choice-of-anchor B domain-containing protein
MKKFLPLFLFLILSQLSFGQLPPLNMTLHDQWDPDTLPSASGIDYNDIWGFVDCSGNEYAIIGSASMVHFFNINDPDNIVELAYFPGGQTTIWRDIKTYRDRAYAVSDNTSEGLMIFDLSNIQDTIIKTYQSNAYFGKSHSIYIDEANGRLYAAGTNTQSQGLIVFDIATDPDNPQLLASVNLPGGGYIHDVYVRDNIAYCSHGYNGFYVWDFGIPTNPVHRASVVTGGYNHSSALSDDGSFAIFAEEVPIGLPLGVMDLTDVAAGNIEVVNTFKFPLLAPNDLNNRPHNPFIRGDYLIVSYYHDGVQIFDISDPLNVTQVAYYDTYDNNSYSGYEGCWGVYPFFPSGVIVASDINQGLFVLTADSIDFAPVDHNLTPDATLISDIPTPFCEGETALLTVESGEDTYQWYQDNQPIGENENFLFVETSGTYYVEITDGQCNAVSEEITLVVKEGPDLSSLPNGNFEICENETLFVQAPDTLDQYVWLKDGNVYQQGGNTLEISEAGDYSLLANLDGCTTTSEIISVAVLPLPDADILNENLSLCTGDQLTLEASSGGDQYVWYLNNVEIAQTSTNNYSINEGGTYQVQVASGSCSALSDEVEITENELPDVSLSFLGLSGSVDSNQVYLCYNELFILAVPANATSQFQWYKSGTPTGNNTNTLEVSEEGEYYVEVVTDNNCSDESELIEVNISQPIAFIEFDGATLSNQGQWTAYQWFMNGNLIVDATESTYAPSSSGEYYCVITNDVGCESVSNFIQVLIEGVENISGLTSFSMFPNPVSDLLIIELNSTESLSFELQIIDTHGKILKSKGVDILDFEQVTFDLRELPSGVYFVRLKTNEKQMIQRIVKM